MKKCGSISILGRPNVGKSTLLNTLIGEKIAIVTPRPQTTRNSITGILTKGDTQFIFVDTPGLHKSKNRLGDRMNSYVYETAKGVDVAFLMCEADKMPGKPEKILLETISQSEIPCILVLNKVDAVVKEKNLPVMAAYASLFPFAALVPISAQTGDGIDELLAEAEKLLPEGEHIFADNELTDQPERVLAAELVREKLMRMLQQEIPYGLTCESEHFSVREDGMLDINILIVCEKLSHKSIIIGKNGSMLKEVGTKARADMEKLFGSKVFLQLWVKVKEDWQNSPSFLNEMDIFSFN